jgi:hypothetical protein
MPIVAYSAGSALLLKAMFKVNDNDEKDRLVRMAAEKFEMALKSTPLDHMILCNYAVLLRWKESIYNSDLKSR